MSELCDDVFQMRIENLAAETDFGDLLDVAVETCLDRPDQFLDFVEQVDGQRADTPDAQLSRKLGLWGLRAALDIESFGFAFYNDGADSFSMRSLITSPDLFSSDVDKTIQNKIEALGRSILDEAFDCLGPEASEKLVAFRGAETAKQQKAIIVWLVDRVADIVEQGQVIDGMMTRNDRNEPNDNDSEPDPPPLEHFYHPARLSPKLIGKYPDVHLSPTCLGVSILVAAFFSKADVPYMHAGVMRTSFEGGCIYQILSISGINEFAEKEDIILPGYVKDKMKAIENGIVKDTLFNRGYHASVIARLADDSWLQIDPNYRSNVIYTAEDSGLLQKCYDNLRSIDDHIAGAQQLFVCTEALVNGSYMNVIHDVANNQYSYQEPEQALDEAMQASNPMEFLKTHLLQFLAFDDNINTLTDVYLMDTGGNKTAYTDRLLEETLTTYVFQDASGGDIGKCIERCQRDDRYKARRIEDLKMAPLYMLLRMQGQFMNFQANSETFMLPPTALEIGLPEYRIGACVLSDFAVYTGDELPLSFWATYLPSYTALGNHFPDKSEEFSVELAKRMAQVVRSAVVRYLTDHDILREFPEQEEGGE